MDTKQLAAKLGISVDELEFSLMIDELSSDNTELKTMRDWFTRVDPEVRLPRNLIFNYKTQTWIE